MELCQCILASLRLFFFGKLDCVVNYYLAVDCLDFAEVIFVVVVDRKSEYLIIGKSVDLHLLNFLNDVIAALVYALAFLLV